MQTICGLTTATSTDITSCITGLFGVRASLGCSLTVNPLVPAGKVLLHTAQDRC